MALTRNGFIGIAASLVAVVFNGTAVGEEDAPLVLADSGKTVYSIVVDRAASDNVRFAAWDLQRILRKATDVDFPLRFSDEAGLAERRIEIGTRRGAELAGAARLARLKHNGSLSLSATNGDIALVGADADGVVGAVYDFLGDRLGCRWWSAWDETIPHRGVVRLKPFERLVNPPMDSRWLLITDRLTGRVRDGNLFQFRNGINMLGETEDFPNVTLPSGCKSLRCEYCVYGGRCHTIFNYVPPKGKNGYFDSHPAYFSYSKERGARVPDRHLCFSNPGLRREFSKNFLTAAKKHPGKSIFVLELMDTPGAICECEGCAALAEKYGTPGAPFFDFAVELAGELKALNPEARLHLALYRKEQTEIPPNAAFPAFPDNVMVFFAPISDDFSKPLTHRHNADTYENFKKWCRLVKHAWSWYYPMPYTTLNPYAGIRRTTEDQRAMIAAGLTGTGYELDVGRDEGANFFDLQFWVYTRFFRDPSLDVETLVREFFRGYYGAAADDVWRYWDELERLRETYPEFLHWKESLTAGYTPERLVRWLGILDAGAAKLKDDPASLQRLGEMRQGLDLMVLARYRNLKRVLPSFDLDEETLYSRLTNVCRTAAVRRHLADKVRDKMLQRVEDLHRSANAGLLRPVEFKHVPDEDFMQSFAIKGGTGCKRRPDPDSAIGASIWDDKEGLSGRRDLELWVFDGLADRQIIKATIRHAEMVEGKYHFYKLGTVRLTPSTYVVVGDCWIVLNALDDLYVPGVDEKWDVWVSLKFEGPQYFPSSKLDYSRVSFDRTVLIRARDTAAQETKGTGGRWAEPEKVARVLTHETDEARVEWWGFDPEDSTRFLQAAIDSGAKRVIVSRRAGPWVTSPLRAVSNQEILFEAGTELVAKPGAFRGVADALLTVDRKENVAVRGLGPGVRLRMRRDDYAKPPYEKAEWRHGLSLLSARRVTVEKLEISETGGDGVYIADGAGGEPCRDIVLRDVVSARNWRQGVSVISCDGLLMERCTMKETRGTAPEAGIDFEPNNPRDVLANCVLKDCVTENNAGKGFEFTIFHISAKSRPVGFRLENCRSSGDKVGLAYELGSNDYDVPYCDGTLVVENCRFENSRKTGLVVCRKPFTSGTATFRNCVVRNACSQTPTEPDVSVTVFGHGAYPADAIVFDRVSIHQPVARPWLKRPVRKSYSGRPTILSGEVRVKSPNGVSAFVMDEKWRQANFPFVDVRKPLPRRGFDPQTVRVTDRKPGEWVELTTLRTRFDVRYVFYADRARTVGLRGILTEVYGGKFGKRLSYEIRTFDGTTKLAGGDLKGGPETVLDCSVPAAGFYRLKIRTWSNGFRLSRADVPVALDVSEAPANFVASTGSVYYYAARGEASDVFVSGEPSEYVSVSIRDASGKAVWTAEDFCDGEWAQVASAKSDGLLEIRIARPGAKHAFEDFSFGVYGVRGLLFLSPERHWK